MNTSRTILGLLLILILMAPPSAFALQAVQNQGILVGHLTHVEGNFLRYVYDDEEWVPLVKDSPVGTKDLLFCDADSKAEIIIPNNTWVRTGATTKLHIIKLENDATEMDFDSGLARFYNKSTATSMHVTTPLGSVHASSRSAFDIYLQADSVHIKPLEGTVTFNYLGDNSNHTVTAGGTSLMADYNKITAGADAIDDAWDEWNLEMDTQWKERLQDDRGEENYLPETIRHEYYPLRENGIWETVYYQGRNCSFWRPLHVPSYWSPYTVGRWTVWYGDQCWIPYEPFGYVTHHYGNWLYIESCGRWYWAPPHCHRRHKDVYFLVIPFAWNPGRVSWIHRGDYVGWIPLAPSEMYYGYRSWGPLSRVVAKDPRHRHTDFDLKACRYKHHAVIVKKNNLYNVVNYNTNRIRNRAAAFIDDFRREAGINNMVIKNFKTMKQRFAHDIRTAKKTPRSVPFTPPGRLKLNDRFVPKNRTIQRTAVMTERSTMPKQPLSIQPARTKKFSDTQPSKDNSAPMFKPLHGYKPALKPPAATSKMRAIPQERQRIGIPGGKQRQVLPRVNRQRPAPVSGVTFQKKKGQKSLNMQKQESTPRLKVQQSAPYANKGREHRSYLAPKSSDFGRR